MSFDVKHLYAQKQREFAQDGGTSTSFQADFLTCCNRTINEINRKTDAETRIGRIGNMSDSIGLDQDYEDIFSQLVSMHLYLAGQRPAPGGVDAGVYKKLIDNRNRLIDEIRWDTLNQAQHDAEDDDDDDFAALGGTASE